MPLGTDKTQAQMAGPAPPGDPGKPGSVPDRQGRGPRTLAPAGGGRAGKNHPGEQATGHLSNTPCSAASRNLHAAPRKARTGMPTGLEKYGNNQDLINRTDTHSRRDLSPHGASQGRTSCTRATNHRPQNDAGCAPGPLPAATPHTHGRCEHTAQNAVLLMGTGMDVPNLESNPTLGGSGSQRGFISSHM